MRYLLLACIPPLFLIIKKHISWPIAYFYCYVLFFFILRNYPITECFMLILISATLFFGGYLAHFSQKKLGFWLVCAGSIQAVIAIFQRFGVHILFTPNEAWGMYLATGTMGHNTVLGPLLVACLAPALWMRNYVCAAIILCAALLCSSSMTFASLGFVLWVFYWYRTSNFWACISAYLCVIVGAILWISFPNMEIFGTSGRVPIWIAAIEAFKSAWIVGHGLTYWPLVYLPQKVGLQGDLAWIHIHSDYLEILVAYGVSLFIPLLYAIYQFVSRFKPSWPHAVCGAILINALANFPFQIVPIALIFIVCWAYCAKNSQSSDTLS